MKLWTYLVCDGSEGCSQNENNRLLQLAECSNNIQREERVVVCIKQNKTEARDFFGRSESSEFFLGLVAIKTPMLYFERDGPSC